MADPFLTQDRTGAPVALPTAAAIIEQLIAGTSKFAIVDAQGNPVVFDPVQRVIPTDAQGNPLNSDWQSPNTSGPGTAVGDILWSIDTTNIPSLVFIFGTGTTGFSAEVEATWDGTTWKNTLPYHRLDAVAGMGSGSLGVSSQAYGLNTQGAKAVRLKVSTAGTAGPLTSKVRTLGYLIPDNSSRGATTHNIVATTAIGAANGVVARTGAGFLRGFSVENLKATGDLFIGFSVNTAWTAGNGPVFRVPAGGNRSVTFPGDGVPVGNISYKVFTDAALTAPASTGDMIGYVGHSA